MTVSRSANGLKYFGYGSHPSPIATICHVYRERHLRSVKELPERRFSTSKSMSFPPSVEEIPKAYLFDSVGHRKESEIDPHGLMKTR